MRMYYFYVDLEYIALLRKLPCYSPSYNVHHMLD